jgi:phosphinothricin acetyltransferase
MSRRIASVLAFAPWLVCEIGGRVRGYAYASRHRERAAYQWSVDAGIYVHEDERRRGIGRLLYGSLFALLRLQGFVAAHAGITLPNAASVGLHEALGFRRIGVYPAVGYKLGAWHDVGWWQLRLVETPGQPSPPLSPAAARSLPGWDEALAGRLGDG